MKPPVGLMVGVMIAVLGAVGFGVAGLYEQTDVAKIQNERILEITEAIQDQTDAIRGQSRTNLRLVRLAGDRVKLLLFRNRQLKDFIKEQGLKPPPLTKVEITGEENGGGAGGGDNGGESPPPSPQPSPTVGQGNAQVCPVNNPHCGGGKP